MNIASLLLALLIPALAADEVTDDLIAEFKRFYKGRASVAERIEAIHVLAGVDRPEAVEALVACFDDPDYAVRRTVVDVLGGYRNEACARWLIDNIVENRRLRNPDRLATAIEVLGRMGRPEAAGAILAALERNRRQEQVVFSALEALGRLRAREAVPAVLDLLESRNPAVRIAALDALGEIRDPSANAAVLEHLDADRWQERAAAVAALTKLRCKESIQPLIDRLRVEDGRLREDVNAALVSLTTFNLDPKPDKWQEVWDRVKDGFRVPTEKEIEEARRRFEESQLRYEPSKEDFAGIPTKSKRIVYVIDISGSMEEPLLDRSRFKLKGRTYRDFVKIEIVKEELARTIENLDDTVFFNVIAFATKVKKWKKQGLVQANILNRKAAAKWVRKLKPIGGASQSLKKKAGLTASAGGGLGKTNTYDALMTALDAKAAQAGYDTDLGSPVDTIYFLSDGDPTAGPVTEIDRILDEVDRVNALRKVTIHTISIGRNDRGKVLMRELARRNNGMFIDLGE